MPHKLISCALAASLLPQLHAFQAPSRPVVGTYRGTDVQMMAAPAVVAKKAKVVDEVKDAMEDAMLAFCVRSEGIQVNDMNMLRQKFDDEVTVRCVKNTLFKRAAEEVPKFQGGDELLAYSNYWFFVPEASMRSTVDTWTDWVKETKQEQHDIVGGVFEGKPLDKDGVVAITKLPTKQELMEKTARLLKVLPSNLATTLHQAGAQRLARATKEAAGAKVARAVKAVEGTKQ